MKYCRSCGASMEDDQLYCGKCGAKSEIDENHQLIKNNETIRYKRVKNKRLDKKLCVLGNIIWFILCGFPFGLFFIMLSGLLFISVIGIPFAIQCYKISILCFWPFGKEMYITNNDGWRVLGNIIWIIYLGLGCFILFGLLGILFTITLIGLPLGKQFFKLSKFIIAPFGKEYKYPLSEKIING